jgi:hypothetical protein
LTVMVTERVLDESATLVATMVAVVPELDGAL